MKNLNLPYPIQIFTIGSDITLGKEVADLLKIEPANHQTECFEDGERIPHQAETVRGRDVYIIATSLSGDDMDKWAIDYMRFVWAVKNGQPHRITVILPKLAHQRQDEENRDLRQPKMTDFFPKLLQTVGMDFMVVCKLHNPGSCTINPPMENLHTSWMLIKEIKAKFDLSKIVIGSADMGGSKYARKIAERLSVPLIIVDKQRDKKTGKSKVMNIFTEGEISESRNTAVFVDDIISTFGSLLDAGDELSKRYAQFLDFQAFVTHADFSKKTEANIINSKFSEITVTDTIPVNKKLIENIENNGKKLKILSVAKLIAQTIDNLHNGSSVSALWLKNGDINQQD